MTGLSQFHRAALGVVGPELAADLGAGAGVLGAANGAFFLALFVAQIPVGLALDRIGPRLTVAALTAAGGARRPGAGDRAGRPVLPRRALPARPRLRRGLHVGGGALRPLVRGGGADDGARPRVRTQQLRHPAGRGALRRRRGARWAGAAPTRWRPGSPCWAASCGGGWCATTRPASSRRAGRRRWPKPCAARSRCGARRGCCRSSPCTSSATPAWRRCSRCGPARTSPRSTA